MNVYAAQASKLSLCLFTQCTCLNVLVYVLCVCVVCMLLHSSETGGSSQLKQVEKSDRERES